MTKGETMTDTPIFTRATLPSPVGTLLLVLDGAALVALDFEGFETRMARLLKRRFPKAVLKDGPAPKSIAAALQAYFKGDHSALDALEVRLGGTLFQQKVWAALRAIPAGETRAYGRLAEAIGAPSASRAVGMANGLNPVAIVIPCHRVIGANGALTGYAGGLARKTYLLKHEGAAFRA